MHLANKVGELVEVEPSSAVHCDERHLLKQMFNLDPSLELLDESLEGDKVEMASVGGVGVLRVT